MFRSESTFTGAACITSLLLIITAVAGVEIPQYVHADGPCAGTSHIATQADADSATSGAIIVGKTVVCDSDSQAGVDASAGQAKEDLVNFRCSSGVNTAQLDSKFAICADKFMKQLRATDPSACINSAFRTEQEQAAACMKICNALSCPGKCAAPGHSYHQKGLALDMKSTVSNQTLWTIAAQSGLVNPAGLHSSDPRHVQSSPGNTCAGVAVPSGDGGDYYNDTNHFFPAQSSLPFDQQARQALGMQPPPPPPPPAAPAASAAPTTAATPATTATTGTATPPAIGTLNSTPYAPGTCNPQTYCSQTDGNIYSRATTCVDQIYQKCSAGCAGLVCNATSTNSTNSGLSGLLTPATDNTNTDTNTNLTGTSSFDLIDFFANAPTITGVNVGTATPIDINEATQDSGDISVLAPSSTGGIIQTPPQGTTGGLYVPAQQQTFTSPNLSGSNTGIYGFAQNTFAQQILAQMKAALLAALPYVQPFGGIQTFSE